MTEKRPRANGSGGGGKSFSGSSRHLTLQGDVHVASNDIAELRKLADDYPELARQIVKDRQQQDLLEQNTQRLGMFFAIVLGVTLITATTYSLVQLGWWQSIMFVAALLGISHVLRTLLKGEFSDTTWFGRILTHQPKPARSTDDAEDDNQVR